jgi:hypothetical protein
VHLCEHSRNTNQFNHLFTARSKAVQRSEKRLMRNRKFVPFDWDRHWVRAFAIAVGGAGSTFDLFPPVLGYRKRGKSKTSYLVSMERQQSDWSRIVVVRDNHTCQVCGKTERLEAHHQWPQGVYPAFRYVVQNGVTLCRSCHQHAHHFGSCTPAQFEWLVQDCKMVNQNIESDDFWNQHSFFLNLGWLHLFGVEPDEINWDSAEVLESLKYFETFARINNLVERAIESATHYLSPAKKLVLNKSFAQRIAPDLLEERLSFGASDPRQLPLWR